MSNLAEELSRLTNTAPTWADPEDITDGAKLLEKKSAEEVDDATDIPSNLRKRAAHFLDEDDERYHGKKISRRQLKKDGAEKDEEGENFPEDSDEEEVGDDGSGGSFDEDSLQQSHLEESGKQESEGESSEEESDEDDDDMSDAEGHTSFVDFNNSQAKTDSEESDEEESSIKKLSSTPEELKKGQAVRNQLTLWESLLKTRIELQKVTSKANQLPQPEFVQEFASVGGQEYTEAMQQAKSSLYKVLEQLVHLQTFLLSQNKNTASITSSKSSSSQQKETGGAEDEDDEEIASDSEAEEGDQMMRERVQLKRLKRSQYPGFVTQRHAAFTRFRDDTVQKWYDKTRVSSGKIAKGFSAFDQSALKQIQQILTDKDRLLKRTQLKRSNYKVLGKKAETVAPQEADSEESLPRRDHLKEYDEEIFDDDDFYHQILRELIESKSRDINDPVAITRHWLEIQKLRKKAKKVVDTRASKGRKIRYEVHPKMVNFMASLETSSWTDEAKNELYSSLFGKQAKI